MGPEEASTGGESTEITRYGTQLPDGTTRWYGDSDWLSNSNARKLVSDDHDQALRDHGIALTDATRLRFVSQTVTTQYGPVTYLPEDD